VEIDAQLFHARDQGGSLEAEAGGGAVGAGDATVCLFEGADDFVAFGFASIVSERSHDSAAELTGGHLKGRALGEDHRALDEIFELADISGPMPGGEFLHGCGWN